MSRGPRPSRRLSRLPLRMALQLCAVGLVVGGLTTTVALWLVRAGLDRELAAGLQATADRVPSLVQRRGGLLEERLDAVEAQLAESEPALLARLVRADPTVADAAADLAARFDLDRLELLDARGTVLSSWLGSARAGLVDPGPLSLEVGRPRLRLLRDSEPPTLAVVVADDLSLGDRRLRLVASLDVDAPFLEAAVSGRAAALVVDGLPQPLLEVGEWPDSAPALASDGARRLRDSAGLDWTLASRSLGDGLATVVVAAPRSSIEGLLREMRTAFLLLTLAVGALGGLAGALISRQLTRPVGKLVRAVDAVASGEADYTFRSSSSDVFEELLDSFSRLHRSLEIQRSRSIAAERVAAWREAARHVAHEVKNPLAPIRLTVQNLTRARRQAPERFDGMFDEGMRTILEEVEQLSRMVGEFSEFARLPAPELREVELEQLVARVVELYSARDDLRVVRRFAGDLPRLRLDPDQIGRALKNVIGNAVEAMRSAGADAGPMLLEVGTATDEGTVRIEVADNGPGFSDDTARRIFEPYFTTKSGGTGLGMAITQRIVTEHGGWIAVDNRPGGGAKVVIHLPLPGASASGRDEDGDRP